MELVDTASDFFDHYGTCRVMEGDRAFYKDDDHLTPFGATVLLHDPVDNLLRRIASEKAASRLQGNGRTAEGP